jgi:hypothetical protein
MGDLHSVEITRGQLTQITAAVTGPQAQNIVSDIFHDVGEALAWLEGLAGKFCDAYKNGGTVAGKQVTLKEVLEAAQAIAAATGTPQGLAAAGGIAVALKAIDVAC